MQNKLNDSDIELIFPVTGKTKTAPLKISISWLYAANVISFSFDSESSSKIVQLQKVFVGPRVHSLGDKSLLHRFLYIYNKSLTIVLLRVLFNLYLANDLSTVLLIIKLVGGEKVKKLVSDL